jgi:hypothetical protein
MPFTKFDYLGSKSNACRRVIADTQTFGPRPANYRICLRGPLTQSTHQ